jgi:hypothetical protein
LEDALERPAVEMRGKVGRRDMSPARALDRVRTRLQSAEESEECPGREEVDPREPSEA